MVTLYKAVPLRLFAADLVYPPWVLNDPMYITGEREREREREREKCV